MWILKPWGMALAAAAALAACGGESGSTTSGNETQAVQIYEVPPAQLQSVQRALREVLVLDNTGSVSSSDGRLVVLAPASTQASIGKAVESLSQRPTDTGPASETPVRLRFWLLHGSTTAASPDPRLEPLKPALDEASTGLGVQGYTLQGFVDVLTMPGKGFESRSSNLVIDGYASRSAAGVMLSAGIDMTQPDSNRADQIRTDVLLEPGQFLVLGTSAAADGDMKLIVAQAQLPVGED